MSSLLVLLKEEGLHRCENIYVAPSIPEKKISGAVSLYAKGVAVNEAVALIDDTVFGSAKDGLLVTDSCLYCKEPFEESIRITFEDIQEVRMDGRKLFVNGKKIYSFTQPGRDDLAAFFGVLRRYIAALKTTGLTAGTTPSSPDAQVASEPTSTVASEPAPAPATQRKASLLKILPQDGTYTMLKRLNTIDNVFGIAMSIFGEYGPIDEAKKAFQTFVSRSVTAFREEVVEKRSIQGLANDLATYEVAGAAIGWLVAEMSRRQIPENLMKQVLLEGSRATFNIQGSVQTDPSGQILLRLIGLHGEQAEAGPASFLPHLALRLAGGNLQGRMQLEYDLDGLLAAPGAMEQFESLIEELDPAFERFLKTLTFEADLMISSLQNKFPLRD